MVLRLCCITVSGLQFTCITVFYGVSWFHCLFLFAGLCLRVDVWMVRAEGRYPPCPPGTELDVAGPVILFTFT